MKILIDADGCPVVDICLKTAKAHSVECIIFCDTSHIFERDGAKTVTVSKGADSVDFKLVGALERGDIAVTQDYGLAAMCLAKGARALNQNGLIYSVDNIDALLASRYETKKLRMAGGRIKGPSKRTHAQDEAFLKALESMLK